MSGRSTAGLNEVSDNQTVDQSVDGHWSQGWKKTNGFLKLEIWFFGFLFFYGFLWFFMFFFVFKV